MPTTILEIIGLILGAGESLVPVFIHNPKSQAIEGVIVSTANAVYSEMGQLFGKSNVTPTTSTSAQPTASTGAPSGALGGNIQ